MKKGKWNYTEDITYTVVLVKLLAVPETKMHWQNALVGKERQVVAISHKKADGSIYQFWIDNQDGSGLQKISAGGGPGSYSAHVGAFEFIRELPESEWQQWDPIIHRRERDACDAWQKENYPEEYEKLQSLKRMWEKSPMNPRNIK